MSDNYGVSPLGDEITDVQRDSRDDIIQGLRELADWLALHPDVRVDHLGIGAHIYGATKENVVAAALASGKFEKQFYGSMFEGSVTFAGGVRYELNSSREEVCTKIVVGHENVLVPDPDAPKIVKEREIVEWECIPILGQVPRG
jgi:hypothetical protein